MVDEENKVEEFEKETAEELKDAIRATKEKIEHVKEEYIQIDMKVIVIGLIAGVIASLWAVLPFFINGVSNLLYMTVVIGLLFIFIFGGFNKKILIKSGALAVGVFFLISYLIVPFASGFLLESDSDILQINTEGLETVNLALPNLFCQGCSYSAQNALKGIPGVVDAKVSFNDKSGIVVYNPDIVTPETIVSNGLIQGYGGKIIND